MNKRSAPERGSFNGETGRARTQAAAVAVGTVTLFPRGASKRLMKYAVVAPLALLIGAFGALAQRSPYPGTSVPGIKLPGGKPKTEKEPQTPMPSFRGVLKSVDGKSLVLSLGDYREIDFKRTDKTKFFRDGKESAAPDAFQPGDQISVEASEDARGFFIAANVYWEKPASAVSAAAKDEEAVDAWKDVNPPATEMKPPPAKPDPEDPGPPRLQRGRPADPNRGRAKEPPAETTAPESAASQPPRAATPAEISRDAAAGAASSRSAADADLPFGRAHEDPLIRKAADSALDFTETLPNYVCREVIARYTSQTSPARWQPVDVLTADIVYENQKEDYRNLAVNGKPLKKPIEETDGAWSTGEFGTVLMALFSPASNAEFRFRANSRASGIPAKEYSYEIARENSHWTVRQGSQTYQPAYSGSVWIEPATGRVLRIEMQAKGLPPDFPADHVESATDYDYIRLGGTRQYLLPSHAEVLICQRGTNNCSKNTIDFRNYHKYEGQSTITFGDDKP